MDPFKRYEIVKETISELKTNSFARTYGWYALHYSYLKDYYEHFETFEKIHPEFDSNEFRSDCRDMGILLDKLLKTYMNNQWFNLIEYLNFNIILLRTIDYVYNAIDTDDDLTSIMMTLNV
jgi:hypothetical protein